MAGSEIEPDNSTSGEEEEVSFEGSESESEPDKTSTPPPSSKKPQLVPNSSSDESDSESDPDNLPVPDPSIKPLSSKPMDDNPAKKPRFKNPTSLYSPPPFNQSTGKRAPAGGDGGDVKRVKKATVVAVVTPECETGGEKKQLFQRLFTEENEIELIQGMIDYVEQKGKDPVADVNEFHDFVKESLHVDVNNRQVLTKARRLKKKFENNVAKVEKNGKVRSFSNPHEKKMYELSKNLWGSDRNNNVVMSLSSKKVNVKVNVAPKTNKSRKTVSLGNVNGGKCGIEVVKPKLVTGNVFDPFKEEFIMSKGLEKLSGAEKVEMEEKWKDLKVQELEFFVKKVELLKEQAEFVLNAITKSGGAK